MAPKHPSPEGVARLQKAEKKATSSGGFFSFGSSTADRMEEAADLFKAAATQFKNDGCYKDAGDAFLRAADCSFQAQQPNDANAFSWEAAKVYKQTNPELAVSALIRAVKGYRDANRYRQAGDRQKEIAQLLVDDLGDLRSALDAYAEAAKLYELDGAEATASACYKDVADLAAQLDDFPRAIETYDKVIKQSLKSPLTKYSVKEYFFKSGLCYLASGDLVDAGRAIGSFVEQDPSFAQTREHKFLTGALEAVEAGDPEAYTAHVVEYDQLTKLDPWKTQIMLKIKKGIAEEPGLT